MTSQSPETTISSQDQPNKVSSFITQLQEVQHLNSMLLSDLLSIQAKQSLLKAKVKNVRLENLSPSDYLRIKLLLQDLQYQNVLCISTLNSMMLDLIDTMD